MYGINFYHVLVFNIGSVLIESSYLRPCDATETVFRKAFMRSAYSSICMGPCL